MQSVQKCSLTVLLMKEGNVGAGGADGASGGDGGVHGILTVVELIRCHSCSVGWTNHVVRKTTPRSIQVHQLDDRLSLQSRIDFPVGSSGRDPQHGISPRRASECRCSKNEKA
ncbi:Teichoic acids export ATP-binding protein TagH [Trichinella pseudospiralis]